MSQKRVFLSFAYEDLPAVKGLRLLAANNGFALEFYDESIRTPIDSTDADYVRRVIREKIARTSVTVCLIGTETYKSKWVEWELEQSRKKGNAIIAMAVKGVDRAVLPKLIKEEGLTFHAWDPQGLGKLIQKA